MSFIKDVFSNFFAMIFSILSIISIIIGFVSCALAVPSAEKTNPLVYILIFGVIGLILLAVSKAFAKRG